MKISRTIKHHFSMGHYEWMEVGLTVEKDIEDGQHFGAITDAMDGLKAITDAALTEDFARVLGATDEAESYVHVATEWE